MAAIAPSLPLVLMASLGLGMASTVPQQLVPFAAVMSPPQERGRSVGTVVSGIMIGILLGRTLGGGVSALLGWRAVFMMAAMFMVIVGVVTSFLLPVGRPTTNLSYRRLLASLWPLVRDHRLLRDAMVTQALLWAAFNAFWANLATLLADSPLHLGSFWAGALGLVGAAGALAASVGGRTADRIGPRRVVTFSIALVTIAYVVLFGAPVSMVALLIGVVVLDFGLQAALVSNQMRAFSIDLDAQGRINTLYMTATFLGGAIGAAISGWLMSLFGWSGVASLGCAAGLAAALYHSRSRDRGIPGPAR